MYNEENIWDENDYKKYNWDDLKKKTIEYLNNYISKIYDTYKLLILEKINYIIKKNNDHNIIVNYEKESLLSMNQKMIENTNDIIPDIENKPYYEILINLFNELSKDINTNLNKKIDEFKIIKAEYDNDINYVVKYKNKWNDYSSMNLITYSNNILKIKNIISEYDIYFNKVTDDLFEDIFKVKSNYDKFEKIMNEAKEYIKNIYEDIGPISLSGGEGKFKDFEEIYNRYDSEIRTIYNIEIKFYYERRILLKTLIYNMLSNINKYIYDEVFINISKKLIKCFRIKISSYIQKIIYKLRQYLLFYLTLFFCFNK